MGRITHVGRGVFLGVSHAPTARGQGPSTSQLWGSVLFMHTPFDAELPNLTCNTCGEGLFLEVSHAPTRPKGAERQRYQILGFFSIYAYTLCRRTTKFDVIKHVGKGVNLAASPTCHPKRPEFHCSPILGFSCTYAYVL